MPSINLVHTNALGHQDVYQCAWNDAVVILFRANAAGALVGVQEERLVDESTGLMVRVPVALLHVKRKPDVESRGLYSTPDGKIHEVEP